MKYAQLVIGPAGCGKSTYCYYMQNHCDVIRRVVHVINLDPAAEHFRYQKTADVRDLISIDDAMEEMELGPNGGLLFCMDYVEQHLHDWLAEELDGFGEDDYVLFDCPGQIELYSHVEAFRRVTEYLANDGGASRVEVQDLLGEYASEQDEMRYAVGVAQALAAMVHLGLPHVNVMTKMDLCPVKDQLDEFLFPQTSALLAALGASTATRFSRLNGEIAQLVDDYNLVSFVPLDITDEDSIAAALLQIDTAIGYGEDQDVRVKDMDPPSDIEDDHVDRAQDNSDQDPDKG